MATLTVVPRIVSEAVDQYLACVEREIPGRVSGFYIVGSAALGDFRPGRSDVDLTWLSRRWRSFRWPHMLQAPSWRAGRST